MKVIEGRSPAERNKIIAAVVLGILALAALYYAFGRGMFGGSPTPAAVANPSPSPARPTRPAERASAANETGRNFYWQTVPIDYRPGTFGAPDPGRNIFAFYEPCRGAGCPTPTPTPVVVITPTPLPPPPIVVAFITPQSVYAGSRGFRLEVSGDKIPSDARIYFSQSEMPTRYVNPQRLVADIPANLIAVEGPRQIIVQTPDGKLYSNPVMLNVQAPPKPQVQYVGMIARRHANNDTAFFREQGKPTEFGARLNDVVGGRFRVVSISSERVVLEDVNLGFRHPLELFRPPPGTLTSVQPSGRGPTGRPQGFDQGFPTNTGGSIPGIPDNIPRYVPPANRARPTPQPNQQQKDEDDNDDGKDPNKPR